MLGIRVRVWRVRVKVKVRVAVRAAVLAKNRGSIIEGEGCIQRKTCDSPEPHCLGARRRTRTLLLEQLELELGLDLELVVLWEAWEAWEAREAWHWARKVHGIRFQ